MSYSVALNNLDLLRDVWIPQTNDSVHAASDNNVFVFWEVETLDPLVDVEDFLISVQPHSGIGFLGLFCVGVASLVHSSASWCTTCKGNWQDYGSCVPDEAWKNCMNYRVVKIGFKFQWKFINVTIFTKLTHSKHTQTILYAKTCSNLSYNTFLFIHLYLPITNAVSWWFEQDITWPISW